MACSSDKTMSTWTLQIPLMFSKMQLRVYHGAMLLQDPLLQVVLLREALLWHLARFSTHNKCSIGGLCPGKSDWPPSP